MLEGYNSRQKLSNRDAENMRESPFRFPAGGGELSGRQHRRLFSEYRRNKVNHLNGI